MARPVIVDVKTRGADRAAKQLGKVDKGLGRLAKSAAGVAVGFFGVQGLINGFRSVVESTKQQALVEAQLNAVLKSTASVAGLTAKELTNMASALQKQTRFGDEAIIKAQSLMLTFTKVGKDVFPNAIETVLNMSEAMGQDLQQGVIQVGKALNDPILGVTALRRVGVQLSKQQEQQVKDFVAVGDVASAQKIILGELETQFGGVAKAAGETLGGSLDIMSNAVGDAGEALGEQLAPVIIGMATSITVLANKTESFFDNLSSENIDAIQRNAIALATMASTFVLVTRGAMLARTAMLGFVRATKFLLIFEAFDLAIANVTSNIDLLRKKFLEFQLMALQSPLIPDVAAGGQTIEELKKQIDEIGEQSVNFDWGNLKAMFGGVDGTSELNTEKIKKDLEDLQNSFVKTGSVVSNTEKKTLKESLENMAEQGTITKENALSTTKAKSKEATAAYISSIFQSVGFPANILLAGLANVAIDKLFQPLMQFQTGGSIVTKGRTTLPIGNGVVVGDNASGMERIDFTPLPSPTSSGSNIVVNINAPVVDEFVVDSIIPAIRRAEKLNL